MGKTSFNGPVYGAKSLIWQGNYNSTIALSTSAATTFSKCRVPAYETWLVTELQVYRGSTHSTTTVVALLDDSTVVANVAITSSLAGSIGSTTPTPTPGEYEGVEVAANSTLALTLQEGTSSIAGQDLTASVYGYIRFLSSTRAE